MEKTLGVINRMVEDGVIEKYAVGGAVAAIFYIEPINTHDVDVFFQVRVERDDLTILAPLYAYLARAGYKAEGETVNIEGWDVQFLPVFNPLIDEAVREAATSTVGQTAARVMQAEHLMAIMLQTKRAKDYARLSSFIEHRAFDEGMLREILVRHRLITAWQLMTGKRMR